MAYTHISTDHLLRLYHEEGISVPKIARLVGMTKQGVYNRLKKAGVEFEIGGPHRYRIDPDQLRRLYMEQGLNATRISERLGVPHEVVRRRLHGLGFKLKPGGPGRKPWEYPGLAELKIGESMVLPKPESRGKIQGIYYEAARRRGIKVSVRIEGENVRLIRVQ